MRCLGDVANGIACKRRREAARCSRYRPRRRSKCDRAVCAGGSGPIHGGNRRVRAAPPIGLAYNHRARSSPCADCAGPGISRSWRAIAFKIRFSTSEDSACFVHISSRPQLRIHRLRRSRSRSSVGSGPHANRNHNTRAADDRVQKDKESTRPTHSNVRQRGCRRSRSVACRAVKHLARSAAACAPTYSRMLATGRIRVTATRR
jgi:hypothetical protein